MPKTESLKKKKNYLSQNIIVPLFRNPDIEVKACHPLTMLQILFWINICKKF